MKVIAIANQKGGVGKTTTSVNLGAALAEAGKTVIVMDMDPQANSTSAFGFDPGANPSIYQHLIDRDSNIHSLLLETKYENLSLIPCDMDLAGCEIEMAKDDDHLVRLRNIMLPFKASDPADYLLMDCPPSLGVIMTSSLAAADELLVPLQCEYFGMEGLAKIVEVHRFIREAANHEVILEGIVMTMADSRTNLSNMVINDVRGVFPEIAYDTVVPRNVRLSEAPSYGQSILEYAPTCSGAAAYRSLAEEFLKRREA